jgi:hypothetical protein
MEIVREMDDPCPYTRGMVAEIGYDHAEMSYTQPERLRGITKNSFYSLYELAMLGITSHSKLPIRIATMGGFALSGISLLFAAAYLVYNLIYWNEFSAGVAPVVIGLFFLPRFSVFSSGSLVSTSQLFTRRFSSVH